MNVSCPQCNAVYRVDPERIPAGGVLTRCALCRETFEITPEEETTGAGEPRRELGAAERPAVAPEAEPEEVAQPEPEPVAQADGEPAPVEAEVIREPGEAEESGGRAEESGEAEVAGDRPQPSLAETPRPAGLPAGPEAPAEPVRPVEPVSAPAGAGSPSPFGAADPDAKARRLARALMSDIVMYHPDRRDQALREGTLRTEFREEITKSWEEYVEQVGAERARRTPHFRDALNDILARGQKVF